MGEFIQARTVVNMLIAKRGYSEGYARLLIFRHRKQGTLKSKHTLRFGTRFMYLFDPIDVQDWINDLKRHKKS